MGLDRIFEIEDKDLIFYQKLIDFIDINIKKTCDIKGIVLTINLDFTLFGLLYLLINKECLIHTYRETLENAKKDKNFYIYNNFLERVKIYNNNLLKNDSNIG